MKKFGMAGTALLILLPFVAGQGSLAATTCWRFDVSESELPRHGVHGGVWLSDGRLALDDELNYQPLVYDLDDRTVRRIGPKEQPDLADGPHRVMGMVPAGDGVVATWYNEGRPFTGVKLLRLDSNLKPVRLYTWPEDWGDDSRPEISKGTGLPLLTVEISGTKDGLVALINFVDRKGFMRLTLPEGETETAVKQTGWWPELETELHPQVPFFVKILAVTSGEDGQAHALRFDGESPFIQRLVGDGERLKVFPALPGPMSELPAFTGMGDYARWWWATEKASFPTALYAEGPLLYVLMRVATDEGPEWTLHAVDPLEESLLHSVRLPTRAVHATLVSGPDPWALVEGVSFAVDEWRRPVGLLLRDSETIRSGGQLTCG